MSAIKFDIRTKEDLQKIFIKSYKRTRGESADNKIVGIPLENTTDICYFISSFNILYRMQYMLYKEIDNLANVYHMKYLIDKLEKNETFNRNEAAIYNKYLLLQTIIELSIVKPALKLEFLHGRLRNFIFPKLTYLSNDKSILIHYLRNVVIEHYYELSELNDYLNESNDIHYEEYDIEEKEISTLQQKDDINSLYYILRYYVKYDSILDIIYYTEANEENFYYRFVDASLIAIIKNAYMQLKTKIDKIKTVGYDVKDSRITSIIDKLIIGDKSIDTIIGLCDKYINSSIKNTDIPYSPPTLITNDVIKSQYKNLNYMSRVFGIHTYDKGIYSSTGSSVYTCLRELLYILKSNHYTGIDIIDSKDDIYIDDIHTEYSYIDTYLNEPEIISDPNPEIINYNVKTESNADYKDVLELLKDKNTDYVLLNYKISMDKFSEINSLASTGIKCNEKSYNITGVIYSCNNSHFSSSTCYKKDCINGLHSVINDDLYRLVNLKNKDNLDNQVCSFGEEKSKSYVYIILLESEEATTYMDNIIEEVEFKGGKSFDISLISGVFLIKLEYIILTLLILLIIYLLWNCNKIYHTDLIKNKTIQEFYIEN